MYVPKQFKMDPQVDDLLFDGYDLKRGMIVILEDDNMRSDTAMTTNPDETADRYNRWCTVFNNPRMRDGSVEFIALYEDETKKKMVVAGTRAWYVKKDSIPNTTSTRHTDHSDCFQNEKVNWAPIGVASVEEIPEGIKIAIDAVSHHPEVLSINSEYGKELEAGEENES